MVRTVRCLTIGSSDSGGGAGIQGDVKAWAALGVHGSTAVVAVTAQNTIGVADAVPVAPWLVAAQLDAVLDDIGVDAVKIGTTWSREVITLAAARCAGLGVPVIVDPVLGTASGSVLCGGDAAGDVVAAVRAELLPIATVVTPNLAEAAALAGLPGATDPAELAEAVAAHGARAVLVTDARPDSAGGDWLLDVEGHHPVPGRRYRTGCEHGAGCAHSAIIAASMARGDRLRDAAELAHRIVSEAVRLGPATVGRGVHPVDVAAAVRALGLRWR
jgi:hydroxymethylpyrimidine/phosphomethylpyrimidine kinase